MRSVNLQGSPVETSARLSQGIFSGGGGGVGSKRPIPRPIPFDVRAHCALACLLTAVPEFFENEHVTLENLSTPVFHPISTVVSP